jgi:hypothetical protein
MEDIEIYIVITDLTSLKSCNFVKAVHTQTATVPAVLWIRNYFFRIRIWIPFSAEFWIRIRKK